MHSVKALCRAGADSSEDQQEPHQLGEQNTAGGEDEQERQTLGKPSEETTKKCLQCNELEQKISRLKDMVGLICWGALL